MGAKQSKRSVDISGKEAEGGGEVAAAGAGGEGRVEPLADVDALKPQLNGDAHIQTEQTDKEKDMDSGTPENEKDATTEKEGKEENEKEIETTLVTNGEAEDKTENGESTPAPEDGKKPKKEKVKKKWSLRSISFSRKDKPKQEKKQKDEELKTNGEPEKVPEETAEAAAAVELAAEEIATEASEPAVGAAPAPAAVPEAQASVPVPEPLTNGTAASTPSPLQEAPVAPASLAPTEPEPAPAPASEPEPEQLPVNGLTLEEPKPEVPEEKIDEPKPESPAAEAVEIAPEIPAKEVCVQQMPLLESTPPPLPANPPPSSVASFAATTMAPELTDAPTLPNTADTAAEPHSALPNTQTTVDELESLPPTSIIDATELPSPLKETSEDMPLTADAIEPEVQTDIIAKANEPSVPSEVESVLTSADVVLDDVPVVASDQNEASQVVDIIEPRNETVEITEVNLERIPEDIAVIESSPEPKMQIPEPDITTSEIDDTPLPPPPAQDDFNLLADQEQLGQNGHDDDDDIKVIPEPIAEPEPTIEANHVSVPELSNGVVEISLEEDSVISENAKNKAKAVALVISENGVGKSECNGEAGDSEAIIKELTTSEVVGLEASCEPAPATAAALTPQEPVSVSDKLADLIPEVPDVPEINTETLQATDVAVAN